MTNTRLYLAIGLSVLANVAMFVIAVGMLVSYFDMRLDEFKKIFRSDLTRLKEVLGDRLKHLEER